MKKIHVVTTTKGQTYDPQGTVINKAAKQLGIKNITDVKAGRHFLLIFEESATEEQIKEANSSYFCNFSNNSNGRLPFFSRKLW